jgi:hypothetical protein
MSMSGKSSPALIFIGVIFPSDITTILQLTDKNN